MFGTRKQKGKQTANGHGQKGKTSQARAVTARPSPYSLPPAATTTPNLPLDGKARYGSRLRLKSSVDVSKDVAEQALDHCQYSLRTANGLFQDGLQAALYESLASKLDTVINSIDSENFSGEERDLVLNNEPQTSLRGGGVLLTKGQSAAKSANKSLSSSIISTNYFAKAALYANSTLPLHLPPLQLYLPAYHLLCLAAQYSARAYTKASGSEKDEHIGADWRLGTKAMVIKSVPIDHVDCIVFAIRGSQTFMDWAVNLHHNPESPEGFLDDPGNLCHSGFLAVAKKMIKPVAARLRQMLEENPSRSSFSLLLTGHSAGGAVASLLYAHMLAENTPTELNLLTGCFKRLHCLTFGAPPVSLLPLRKPKGDRYQRSLFMSLINEGDPVPRADPAYVRSLLRLYASPAPPHPGTSKAKPASKRPALLPRFASAPKAVSSKDFVWDVPPGALSNAGRLVVLRAGQEVSASAEHADDNVRAQLTSDQDLRGVVFGDPVMHMMSVYQKRVEVLATRAVIGN